MFSDFKTLYKNITAFVDEEEMNKLVQKDPTPVVNYFHRKISQPVRGEENQDLQEGEASEAGFVIPHQDPITGERTILYIPLTVDKDLKTVREFEPQDLREFVRKFRLGEFFGME